MAAAAVAVAMVVVADVATSCQLDYRYTRRKGGAPPAAWPHVFRFLPRTAPFRFDLWHLPAATNSPSSAKLCRRKKIKTPSRSDAATWKRNSGPRTNARSDWHGKLKTPFRETLLARIARQQTNEAQAHFNQPLHSLRPRSPACFAVALIHGEQQLLDPRIRPGIEHAHQRPVRRLGIADHQHPVPLWIVLAQLPQAGP